MNERVHRRAPRGGVLSIVVLVATSCGTDANGGLGPGPGPGAGELATEQVVGGLNSPTFAVSAPNDAALLFVVEQQGLVRLVRDGALLGGPFLDIRSQVGAGGERGLLGLAFHPDYATNGRFVVSYTDNVGDSRIVLYTVSVDPLRADPNSASVLLTVAQPFTNHNGGQVEFGPDGMLYVALGDGGSGGDPRGHGQNRATLLGSILRLDLDAGAPLVPSDNPFVADPTARPEIWVYGLRNPWRFAFDRSTGDLYIADVGQNELEEVNVQPESSRGGENYGWNTMEGTRCFSPPNNCTITGLELPVFEYDHSGNRCAITGAYVYRGTQLAALAGHYFYGDFCTGFVGSFRWDGEAAVDERDWSGDLTVGGNITSFGQDADGELYIVTQDGRVLRIVAAAP